jgi:hypothetical protein
MTVPPLTRTSAPRRSRFAPPNHGFRLWFCIVGGIVIWMVHISAIASLAGVSCTHPNVKWVMHAITIVLALLTVVAILGCRALLRDHDLAPDLARDEPSRLRFLAVFGLWTGGFSLLLIVWEGAYVAFLRTCPV